MLKTRFFAKKKMFRLWNPFFLNQSERIFIAILAREKNRFYEIRHSHELDTAGVFLQPNKQDIRLENTQVLIDGLHPSVALFWSFINYTDCKGKYQIYINKRDEGWFTGHIFVLELPLLCSYLIVGVLPCVICFGLLYNCYI